MESMAYDFKIIARKNPASELRELNNKFGGCCEVINGKNGETLFDGFDMQKWGVADFEAIVRKYAEMENPSPDDGISYIRKGEVPGEAIVEYTNGMTDANVCLALDAPEFEAAE